MWKQFVKSPILINIVNFGDCALDGGGKFIYKILIYDDILQGIYLTEKSLSVIYHYFFKSFQSIGQTNRRKIFGKSQKLNFLFFLAKGQQGSSLSYQKHGFFVLVKKILFHLKCESRISMGSNLKPKNISARQMLFLYIFQESERAIFIEQQTGSLIFLHILYAAIFIL